MLKRPFWMFVIGGIAACCAALQVRVNYRDQDFSLGGFDRFSLTLDNDSIAFEGSGDPLQIESGSSGLTLKGKRAGGSARRGENRQYFLRDLTVSGEARAILTSSAEARDGKANESSLTDVASETIHFTGSVSSGRIEFPSRAEIDSKATGSRPVDGKPAIPYSRTIHLTGSRGFVTLALGDTTGRLQTGELNGPVTFSIVETSGPGEASETTTLQGSGDLLTFNVSAQPRTITLKGSVKAAGRNALLTGDLAADSMVVTLDTELKPIKVEVQGSPAKTHVTTEAKP